MGKKKKYLLIDLIILATAIATFVFLFLDCYKVGNTTYKGYEVAFGKSLASGSIGGISGESKINFSVYACIAFILPLVIGLINVILHNKLGFVGGVITAVCFLGCAVLFVFLAKEITVTTTIAGISNTKTFEDYGIASTIYPIAATLCCSFGAGAAFASCF